MKAVLIIHNDAISPEVTDLLSRAGVEYFTRFTSVFGKGPSSGPRLGDSIWPGGNHALLLVLPPDKVPEIVSAVKALQVDIPAEGLRVLWWEIEGMA